VSQASSPSAGGVHTFARKRHHSIHESKTPDQFCLAFEAQTNCSVRQIADAFIMPNAEYETFLVGSLPLGLGTGLSDIDLIVLIDSREALLEQALRTKNSRSFVSFSNDANPLSAGHLIYLVNGIEIEMNFILRPNVLGILKRLRAQGPELTEDEVLILGRLRTGWLVTKSPKCPYDDDSLLSDRTFDVYCATRAYVFAEKFLEKARKCASEGDLLQSMHLARIAVEKSYDSFFASRGFPSLGVKWLQFLRQNSFMPSANSTGSLTVFKDNVWLLFPDSRMSGSALTGYLDAVHGFVARTRDVIEEDRLHKIAFSVCPQIHRRGEAGAT
jgi:hypothetical protein